MQKLLETLVTKFENEMQHRTVYNSYIGELRFFLAFSDTLKSNEFFALDLSLQIKIILALIPIQRLFQVLNISGHIALDIIAATKKNQKISLNRKKTLVQKGVLQDKPHFKKKGFFEKKKQTLNSLFFAENRKRSQKQHEMDNFFLLL